MLADLGGADLVNIAHTVPGVQSKLLVKQEIKRPEDLKGKKIATSSWVLWAIFSSGTLFASMAWTRTGT